MSRVLRFSLAVLAATQLGACTFLDDFGTFHASKDGGLAANDGPDGAMNGVAGKAGVDAGHDAGSGPVLNCSNFAACGGGVLGSWTVTSSCLSVPPQTITGCPAATVTVSKGKVTGTFSFKADNTYTLALVTSETVHTFVPKSCLNPGATCPDIDPNNPGNVVDTGTACTESQDITQPSSEQGDYQVVGTQVLMTPSNGAADMPVDFCVRNGVFVGRQGAADGSIVTFFAK